jgi:hypothetical protein
MTEALAAIREINSVKEKNRFESERKTVMMKRIAITGAGGYEDLFVAKALSIMCGYDLCISPPFPQTAVRYGMSMDIEACQWPDSYVYCLDAFTERIIVEHRYGEKFVSDGSVLREPVWLKCRFPHTEPVYEQSMIRNLEKVAMAYAARNYDAIFHLSGGPETSAAGDYLQRLLDTCRIPYRRICLSDREAALQSMAEQAGIPPVMSPSFALSKASRDAAFE